jgi:hypothetical protein
MTVRVTPLWSAMTAKSPDDPPDAAVVADDGTGEVRILDKLDRETAADGTKDIIRVRRRPGDIEKVMEDTGADRLSAMLVIGTMNTMYMTDTPAITDHGTVQEAIDHVFSVLWPPEDEEEGAT